MGDGQLQPQGTPSRVRLALPYAAAILVTVLWSSSYVLIKWGLSDIPPLYFATLRYALAFAVLVGVEATVGRRQPKESPVGRRQAGLLVIAGIAGYTIAQGLQFVGLYYLPAVTTSFLLNFNPFFVLVLSMIVLGEGTSLVQLGGLGLALAGVWAFFSERVAWGGSWFGVLVVVASGLGWAVYLVTVRLLGRSGHMGSLRLTTVTMGAGVAGMAVLTLLSGQYAPLTSGGVLIIVWLATANTALAFFMWNWALRAIPAYELTVLQNVMLVEIALFAFVFLQETITPLMIAGMALVLAGVFAVQARTGGGTAGARRGLPGGCRDEPLRFNTSGRGGGFVPGRLLIFCGIPGSGKTTIAGLVVKSDPDAVHIQTDAVRATISEPTFSPEESDFVYGTAAAAAREALDAGRLVILDATFGSRRRRERTLGALAGHYSRVDVVHVVCDLQVALERNAARAGRAAVPEAILLDMLRKFEVPQGAVAVDSSRTSPEEAAGEIIRVLLCRNSDRGPPIPIRG